MPKPDLSALSSGVEPEGELDAPEPESTDPFIQAASVVREAIEDGDDESLADALKSFVTMHGSVGSTSEKSAKPSLSKSLSKE